MDFMNSTDTDEIVRVIGTPLSQLGEKAEAQSDVPRADFRAIAHDAIKRSFEITPLRPRSKLPFLKGWQKRPSRNPEQIREWAVQYPHFNVGIVCKCFVDSTISLDFDAEGVIEQVENDTGRAMPVTYIVQSRPQSAPWRKHFVFRHTAYSVKHLRTNANVKTIAKFKENDFTRYDVKCNNAQTVAAGSVRDSGEVYTDNDVPVIPIPDWLVNWVLQDIAKFKAAKAERTAERAAIKKVLAGIESATQGKLSMCESDKVGAGDRWETLRSWVGAMARKGIRNTDIRPLMEHLCVDCFEDGEQYIIERKADLDALEKFFCKLEKGPISFVSLNQTARPAHPGLVLRASPTRRSLLLEALKDFPDCVTADEGYKLLARALEGTGFTIDRRIKNHQKRAGEAWKEAGFVAKNITGTWTWTRHPEVPTHTSTVVTDVTNHPDRGHGVGQGVVILANTSLNTEYR